MHHKRPGELLSGIWEDDNFNEVHGYVVVLESSRFKNLRYTADMDSVVVSTLRKENPSWAGDFVRVERWFTTTKDDEGCTYSGYSNEGSGKGWIKVAIPV